jgi:hypothetical protein
MRAGHGVYDFGNNLISQTSAPQWLFQEIFAKKQLWKMPAIQE